jgi:hypothetical protein
MKNRLRLKWDQQQCPLQRGFTKNSVPLNAAFILEEARREALDIGKLLTIVLLDAKSAFDVVVHKKLLKKLYHLGIQDKHCTLIKSLHRTLLLIPFWSQSILHYGFYNLTDYWSNSDTSVICNMQFGTFIFEYWR